MDRNEDVENSSLKEQQHNSINKEQRKQKFVYENTAFTQKHNAYFIIWSRNHSRIKRRQKTFMLITNRVFPDRIVLRKYILSYANSHYRSIFNTGFCNEIEQNPCIEILLVA